MDNGSGCEAWVQLVREIIGSWRLVFRAAVLVLACAPVAVVVTLVLLDAGEMPARVESSCARVR